MHSEIIAEWRIPGDHSRQTNLSSFVSILIWNNKDIKTVMDLGCGSGSSVDLFRSLDNNLRWVGIDLENSPEVEQRARTDADFRSFDGINIPFGNDHFDLIYSNQVFEHVTNPQKLLHEVQRVLRPGGYLVGSTSQLEPYHSYSVWNFTPHGFRLLMDTAGLNLIEVRPGIDALTLIVRAALGRPKFFSRWWLRESPLNKLISIVGWITRKSNEEINFAKLILCGQFCFLARKPNSK